MAKQLIVVVHGVGVKEAGVSADLLATALERGNEIGTKQADDPKPHSSDDFLVVEESRYNRDGKRQAFPARLRRYRSYTVLNKVLANERVIADFYWGDIAAIGVGVHRLLLAILRTILGLSHAVRENAREVFPALDANGKVLTGWKAFEMRFFRRAATGAALIIHGPIAAINIVVLGGVIVAWALGLSIYISSIFDPKGSIGGLLIGALAVLFGYLLLRYSRAFLQRHLAGWVLLIGALLIAFALLDNTQFRLENFTSQHDKILAGSCAWLSESEKHRCIAGFEGIYKYGLWLLGVMLGLWVGVYLCAVVAWFGSTFRTSDQNGTTSLLSPAIALMTLMWLLLIGGLWATATKLVPNLVPHWSHIVPALSSLVFAFLGLAALGLTAFVIHLRKSALNKISPEIYLRNAEEYGEKYRLIVGKPLLYVLNIFLLVIASYTFVSIIGWLDDFTKSVREITPTAIGIMAVIGAVLVGVARGPLSAGLGIFTDVLTYLNDYSWDSEEVIGEKDGKPVTKGLHTRTFVEKLFGLRKNVTDETRQGYWLRRRIRDRLKVLVDQLIESEKPNELVIVSHSQGTVIAIDMIADGGEDWKNRLQKPNILGLITMGSPYTHIHNHYFPSSFAKIASRSGLTPQKPLKYWQNIFRMDDFVGTHLNAPNEESGAIDPSRMWPEERPVPPNGHTMYWVDENVRGILAKRLAFSSSTTRKKSKASQAPAAIASTPRKTDRRRSKV